MGRVNNEASYITTFVALSVGSESSSVPDSRSVCFLVDNHNKPQAAGYMYLRRHSY